MTALRGVGLKNPRFNHALDGADRQAQTLGCLGGAEVAGCSFVVFHEDKADLGGCV